VFLDGNKYHFINTIVPRNEEIVRNIIPQLRQRHVRVSFFPLATDKSRDIRDL